MSHLKKNFHETVYEIANFIYSSESETVPAYGDIIVDGSDNAIMIDGFVCTGCRRDELGTWTKNTTKFFGINVYSKYRDFKPK